MYNVAFWRLKISIIVCKLKMQKSLNHRCGIFICYNFCISEISCSNTYFTCTVFRICMETPWIATSHGYTVRNKGLYIGGLDLPWISRETDTWMCTK